MTCQLETLLLLYFVYALSVGAAIKKIEHVNGSHLFAHTIGNCSLCFSHALNIFLRVSKNSISFLLPGTASI